MDPPALPEPTVTVRRPDGTVHILQPLDAIRFGDAFHVERPVPGYRAGWYRCTWHRDDCHPTDVSERYGTALLMLVEPLSGPP